MKKIFFNVFFLILCHTLCIAMPTDLEKKFAELNISLNDSDLNRINEVYNFWSQKGENIWPGVKIENTPVQIIFPEKTNLLIGHPNPPKDCLPSPVRIPVLKKDFCYIKDNTFMYGAMSGPINKIPAISINTIDLYEKYVRDYFLKNNIAPQNYKKTSIQYFSEILHEMFHAYQDSEQKYLPQKDQLRIRLTKIDYPYQDEESNLLLALEGRILADIVSEKDLGKAKKLWEDWLVVRKERHSSLDPELIKLERYLELKEGTAQYVGNSLLYLKNDDVKPLEATFGDQRFEGYASSDTFKDTLTASLTSFTDPSIPRYMVYVYYTGMAIVSSLDAINPDWKKDLFRRVDGINEGLDTLVSSRIAMPKDTKTMLDDILKRYESEKLKEKIREGLKDILETNQTKLDKFQNAKGLRFKFVFPGAKASNILIYAPVLLTEYKEYRVFEAGCSKIEWKNDDGDVLTEINFTKAIPIILNRKSGVVEIIVQDKDYSDNKTAFPAFDNGIWNWKEAQYDITETDTTKTFTFKPLKKQK